jgi:hypothetical protein
MVRADPARAGADLSVHHQPKAAGPVCRDVHHIDILGRMWARIYAFRTPIVAAMGPVLTALPDILVKIPTLDLSFLPAPWPAWAMGISSFAVIIMKAFETTPNNVPPPVT